MLIRRSISLKWFLKIEGWNLLFFIVYGSAIYVLNLYLFFEDFTFQVSAIGFLGTAVAILLGSEITPPTIDPGKLEKRGVI